MRCPTCGNGAQNTRVYRCVRCGFIYCMTLRAFSVYAQGCHRVHRCPRCYEKRAIMIGW